MTPPTAGLFDLTGKRALITGSSRGIGLVFARGLAAAGAAIVLNGRSTAVLDGAVSALREEGQRATGYAFDVSDGAAVDDAVARIEAEEGPIDILINNAGIQRRGAMLDVPAETWREVLEVNLTAPFLRGCAVARRMIARGGGKIVNVCSVQSELGRATIAPYAAAKGGLKMLTKAMCAEWAASNIQVNGLGPGYFKTEMTQALVDDPDFDAWLRERTPARRWGLPEELVGAAVFLSAPASSFVNGQVLYVDGGLLSVV